jgi:hypothetical protein
VIGREARGTSYTPGSYPRGGAPSGTFFPFRGHGGLGQTGTAAKGVPP